MESRTEMWLIRDRLESSATWECVHFVTAVSAGERDALRRDGYYVAEISGDALVSPDALFTALAETFQFPAYFGRNWSAVDECLSDLEWLDARAFVLIVDRADAHGLAAAFGGLIGSWLFAAQEWSVEGTPFHLIVEISESHRNRAA